MNKRERKHFKRISNELYNLASEIETLLDRARPSHPSEWTKNGKYEADGVCDY